MSLYIGIDVGGTSIKGALIDGEGKLYGEDCVRTGNGVEIVDGIVAICNRFTCKSGGEKIKGVAYATALEMVMLSARAKITATAFSSRSVRA